MREQVVLKYQGTRKTENTAMIGDPLGKMFDIYKLE